MFTVLSWCCFIGAMVCVPGMADLGTAGFRGLSPWEQKQIIGMGVFTGLGIFLGFQGVRGEERGSGFAKLGMIANALALAAVVGIEIKSRM